jgi:rod shape-determining protein MreC
MRSNLSRNVFLVLLCFVLLIIILTIAHLPFGAWLKEGFSTVFAFISRPFVQFGEWIASSWENLTRLSSITSELEKLRQENSQLLAEKVLMEEARKENESLRALLNLKNSLTALDTKAASVLAADSALYGRSLLISLGSNDGIKEQMPVLAPNGGLVGQILEIYPTKSRVLLITDANSFVSGKIQSSGELAVVKGDGLEGCYLERLLKETQMKAGDVVVTSGQGGIFPPGLVIGKIKEVFARGSLHLRATIVPQADFSELKFVLVVVGPKE